MLMRKKKRQFMLPRNCEGLCPEAFLVAEDILTITFYTDTGDSIHEFEIYVSLQETSPDEQLYIFL